MSSISELSSYGKSPFITFPRYNVYKLTWFHIRDQEQDTASIISSYIFIISCHILLLLHVFVSTANVVQRSRMEHLTARSSGGQGAASDWKVVWNYEELRCRTRRTTCKNKMHGVCQCLQSWQSCMRPSVRVNGVKDQ